MATFKVPGPVLWIDFVTDDRIALLTFDKTPVLQVWNAPQGKLEKSVPLPEGEFDLPKWDPSTFREPEPGSKTWAPDLWLGAVSPGGATVVLGGKSAVHALSLSDGKPIGTLPIPWRRVLHGTKPGGHAYHGFAFRADGRQLLGLVQAGELRVGQSLIAPQAWLLSWSMETGFRLNATPAGSGGANQLFRGPPLPGPVPDTLILPYRDYAQRDAKQMMHLEGRPLSTGAVIHKKSGVVLPLLDLLPLAPTATACWRATL